MMKHPLVLDSRQKFAPETGHGASWPSSAAVAAERLGRHIEDAFDGLLDSLAFPR
jgi:hypothetical protein